MKILYKENVIYKEVINLLFSNNRHFKKNEHNLALLLKRSTL